MKQPTCGTLQAFTFFNHQIRINSFMSRHTQHHLCHSLTKHMVSFPPHPFYSTKNCQSPEKNEGGNCTTGMLEVRISKAALYLLLVYVLQLYLKVVEEVMARFFCICSVLTLKSSPQFEEFTNKIARYRKCNYLLYFALRSPNVSKKIAPRSSVSYAGIS